MVENKSIKDKIRVVLTYCIIIALGLLCFFPLWNVLCYSFSSAGAIQRNEVVLLPVDFNLDAYERLMGDDQFWHSFGISVIRVALALVINLVLIVLAAYPLSKTTREFRARNFFMYLLTFAMLFSGGMIPTYMVVKNLGLLNSVWALVLPSAVPIFNLIMVMNFFKGIPSALEEAALLDGATPFQILTRIYIPCSKPVLATVALFSIVGNWNDFFNGLIYMTKIKNYPLMSYISSIQVNLQEMAAGGASAEMLEQASKISGQNLNAAKIVVAVVPLLLIYPLLQKYLINGITIGAVKE